MEKVINCFQKRPDAVSRLICFPWAGGGSTHYARWGNVLSSSIEGNTPGDGGSSGRSSQKAPLRLSSSVCGQASRQGEPSQRAFLPQHAAGGGRSRWDVAAAA